MCKSPPVGTPLIRKAISLVSFIAKCLVFLQKKKNLCELACRAYAGLEFFRTTYST